MRGTGPHQPPAYGSLALSAISLFLLQSCARHTQSVVEPAGPLSSRIASLWWFFFWLLGAIFIVVVVLSIMALGRTHRGINQEPLEIKHAPSDATEARMGHVVTAATIATIVILFVLLIASVRTGKANADSATAKPPITIQLTGNQWWWQVQYLTDDASRGLVTANEIHIPVGKAVRVVEQSNDVIHSFWVPGLNGKRDLIPSHTTFETIEAARAGRYRGQCAEFCGLQHAHMSIWVIAEPENKFNAWMNSQLASAASPTTPVTQRGQEVFLNNACVLCHTIRGTTASGRNGPDLTHFGGRIGIAANTVPNASGYLAGWILDPQSIKPGNQMATIALPPGDLQPLIAYLESLK